MSARVRGRTAQMATTLGGIPLLAALLAAWELAAEASHSPYLPTLTVIGRRFAQDWFGGPGLVSAQFLANATPTLGRVATGWAIGALLGVGVGGLLGVWRPLRQLAAPLVSLGMATPTPSLLPVAIGLFGLGTSMKVFFIAFGTLWPVLTNTTAAFLDTDRDALRAARSLRLRPWTSVMRVRIPAAAPGIAAGLRVGVNAAMLLIVVAELFATTSGIGYLIVRSQRDFDFVGMWSAVLLLCAMGVTANALFDAVERPLMAWHRGVSGVGR